MYLRKFWHERLDPEIKFSSVIRPRGSSRAAFVVLRAGPRFRPAARFGFSAVFQAKPARLWHNSSLKAPYAFKKSGLN
jgi:hypothetical protein